MKSLSNYINESFEIFLELSERDKTRLIELDREYASLAWMHRNDYNFKDILNKKEERKKFFEAYDNGERYNPVVKLGECHYEDDNILERLETLLGKFKRLSNCFLSKYYIENIKKLIGDVNNRIEKLTTQDDMNCTMPAKDVYEKAIETIKENHYNTIDAGDRNIDADEAIKKMQDALDELGYDFTAKKYPNMLPRMNVLPERILRVSDKATFNDDDIEGLIAHEIKGHVGRRFYGYKTGLYLFVHGLDGRNTLDEGMAIWNSLNIVDKPKPNILFNIALKFIIYYHAVSNDFYDTFVKVSKILEDTGNEVPRNVLFNTIIRCKRCCIDTQYKGGNISDSDYFLGYNYVNKLDDEDRENLLKYNVGIKQVYEIPTIKKFFEVNSFAPIEEINVYIPEV